MIFGLPEEEYFASGHNACAGCGLAIAIRIALKAAGKNIIVVNATGCSEVVSSLYPLTSWKIPWIHSAFQNAPAVASGIKEALEYSKKDTKVIVFGGDGALFDIGFGALSGALERGHDITYICLNNGAYQNTGYQRSGATPKFAYTSTAPAGSKVLGKRERVKPLLDIVIAHGIKYAATAGIHDVIDLYKKVKKAVDHKGPSYVELFCPCVPGWKINSANTTIISDLAVKTRFYPLIEFDGKYHLKQIEKTSNIEEFLRLQGRFKHVLKNREILEEIKRDLEENYQKYRKLSEN